MALPADRSQSLSSSDVASSAALIPVPPSPRSGASVHHAPSAISADRTLTVLLSMSAHQRRVLHRQNDLFMQERQLHTQLQPSYGAVVPSSASTAMERWAAWSPADTWAHDDLHTRYDAIPLVSSRQRPIYVPPSALDIVIEWCGRFVYALQEVRYEISYLTVRLLTILGIFWTIRTSVRLFRWFFWDGGYILVGTFLVFIIMLGFLGWAGHSVYRDYQKKSFFTFSKPAPTPGDLDVMPPAVPSPLVMDSIPVPLSPTVQQRSPTTCGSAYVIADALNVRATPGGAIQGKLFRGQEVILLCAQEQVGTTIWVRVQAKQHEGWVSKRFIR